MKNSSLLIAVVAASILSSITPAFGAPKPKPSAKAPAKKAVDPLDIPAFAPIPNEFVFAGTQKDVYKLLSRYTGGISLDKIPEPTDEELATSKDNATLQAIRDVKRILAPLHVIRVRSVSYFALDDEAQSEAFKKLAPKTKAQGQMNPVEEMELENKGYDRSLELLKNAETFYQNLMVKQGGKVQMMKDGETSITVYAFSQPQTFAVVTRGPSRVIVARADGKPDVGAITGIFQRVVAGN